MTSVRGLFLAFLAFAAGGMASAQDPPQDLPEALRAPGETVLLEVHGEGAQIYDCRADAKGNPVWMFREPIASLFRDGKTVGRHYAGPHWELVDGSIVLGKVEEKSPGASPADIPWIKLSAASHAGQGELADITTILRINTQGGVLDGDCKSVGALRGVPYSADYLFLGKRP